MTVSQYANANLGQHLDNGQGGYSGECVSLAIRTMHDVYGVPYGTLYCSKTGGARDLFEQFDGKIPQYFDRITNNPNDYNQLPQAGDLVVWGDSMGSFGHVAVVLNPKPLVVFQQLGTPVFRLSEIHQYPSYYGVLGWLRPKVAEMITPDQLTQLYQDLLHRAPDQGGVDHYVGHYTYDFVENDIKHSAEYAVVNAPKETPSVPQTTQPVAQAPAQTSEPAAPATPAPQTNVTQTTTVTNPVVAQTSSTTETTPPKVTVVTSTPTQVPHSVTVCTPELTAHSLKELIAAILRKLVGRL